MELLRAIELRFKLSTAFEPTTSTVRIFVPLSRASEIELPAQILEFINGWDAHVSFSKRLV